MTIDAAARPKVPEASTRKLVRGSSLLLAGRLLSKGVNFIVQVLIVRALSQTAFGAFAYALSIVMFAESTMSLGLNRAVTRFVPIYHEKEDYDRLFGSLLLMAGTIVGLGLAAGVLLHALKGLVAGHLVHDALALSILLILIFLAPVQALDELLVGLFASFASPRAIFFRKHVLAPGLKLAVVVILLLGDYPVSFLAGGYLVASILGVAIYASMFVRILSRNGTLRRFRKESLCIPWREVFTFSIPLMTTDLVYIMMNTMDVVLLERFHDTAAVASLRAVQPAAKMNQLIMASFGTLYMPMIARLFARDDRSGINQMYWQSAIWIACFSFPIFALTFSIAKPITVLLYGSRYENSAGILALLSFGYYFNAALGFNGLTLKVFNKIRYVVALNAATAVFNLGINLLLIPRWGAMGAAIGTLSALIFHNILKQTGLLLGTGISLFDRQYARVYVVIAVTALALLQVQILTAAPVAMSVALALIGSIIVLRVNRDLLALGQTFPEIMKIPGARLLFRS